MQDLSFRWPHPRFTTALGPVTVRVHTGENAYGLDPDRLRVEQDGDTTVISADGLTWAGGQQQGPGQAVVRITEIDDRVTVSVTATHPDGIRCVAVVLHDQPTGEVTAVREGTLPVPVTGRTVQYPNGWFDLATPLLGLTRPDGITTVVRSLDTEVRAKRFAIVPHFDAPETCDLELIADTDATKPRSRFGVPDWELRRVTDLGPVWAEHTAHIREAYALPEWAGRDDVPAWLRDDTSLVVSLNGMHFTGRIFLDYDGMLDTLRRLGEKIDPKRILAYLPGWEGRYYRWYGRFDVDERMGGAAGFRRLVEGAHDLGARIMPMFGANVAARDLPGFETWAAPGQLLNPSGHTPIGSVDWDASRHYDHSWGSLVNPSYEPWRHHLAEQIVRLHHDYGFDAAFLDISAMYNNDPRGSTTAGLRALVELIRAGSPDLLIAGEAWFDGIGGIIPLVQAGHRDTVPTHHDQPDEALFTGTNRSFGHVCLGDPAFGSTGVHEAGYNAHWRLPVREGVLPTLTVVDGTLDQAPERVDLIVRDAHEYAEKFL
ncbi:hypothetical protein F4553_007959 [Allocatelliglobosispora scoriae]|uniref:Uncharacterized protein n=1 Tax=Allocatelliglobosispora scoriae TaxID=643052 RepID=A0A841C3Q6_9ACTN|nr:hypothetical protein [Allocatelliglobosispora scoriae]MBB5874525.1 hypothetical protein [Allocatelliglobosispora scoriae]